jgi:acetoin utilization protein AcuB
MEIKEMPYVNEQDPLSKALAFLLKPYPIVGVMKDNKLIGIIDDRHLSIRAKDASQIKAKSVAAKCHKIRKIGDILSLVKKFAHEHFKALPFVGKDQRLIGYISRAEVLKELVNKGLIPKISIEDLTAKPIYSIDSNATIADAKNKMKELKVKRLTIVENNRVIGVISSFDILALKIKPEKRQKGQLIEQTFNIDKIQVKEFIREPLVLITKDTQLDEAALKMAEKNVSYAIVVESLNNKKPIGILTARAIFKKVLEEQEKPKVELTISGLTEKHAWANDDIKNAFNEFIKRALKKDIGIEKIIAHIKEGKSTYRIDIKVYVKGKPFSFHMEDEELLLTVNKALDNIESVLIKKKVKTRSKKVLREEEEF